MIELKSVLEGQGDISIIGLNELKKDKKCFFTVPKEILNKKRFRMTREQIFSIMTAYGYDLSAIEEVESGKTKAGPGFKLVWTSGSTGTLCYTSLVEVMGQSTWNLAECYENLATLKYDLINSGLETPLAKARVGKGRKTKLIGEVFTVISGGSTIRAAALGEVTDPTKARRAVTRYDIDRYPFFNEDVELDIHSGTGKDVILKKGDLLFCSDSANLNTLAGISIVEKDFEKPVYIDNKVYILRFKGEPSQEYRKTIILYLLNNRNILNQLQFLRESRMLISVNTLKRLCVPSKEEISSEEDLKGLDEVYVEAMSILRARTETNIAQIKAEKDYRKYLEELTDFWE